MWKVRVSRKIGRAKLHRINLEHPLVEMLRKYETKMSLLIAEQEAENMKKTVQIKRDRCVST